MEEEPEEEAPEPEENQSEIPKTGDNTSAVLYTALSLLSLIGILIIFLGKKKDEDTKEDI